jgi:hypothetical protein
LEKAAEMLEKMAVLPTEEFAKLSDRDFQLPFRLLEEYGSTFDLNAMTLPELIELIRLATKAGDAAIAVKLRCERILGQLLTASDTICNASRKKPDHPLSETQISEILRAVGIDWSALKVIIAATVNRRAAPTDQ